MLTFDDIKDEFMTKVNADPTVQRCLRTIHDGRGTYTTANRLAKRVGETLGKVLKEHDPIENINEWDYVNLIPQSLGLNQKIIVDACRDVQNGLNAKNGIGIRYRNLIGTE